MGISRRLKPASPHPGGVFERQGIAPGGSRFDARAGQAERLALHPQARRLRRQPQPVGLRRVQARDRQVVLRARHHHAAQALVQRVQQWPPARRVGIHQRREQRQGHHHLFQQAGLLLQAAQAPQRQHPALGVQPEQPALLRLGAAHRARQDARPRHGERVAPVLPEAEEAQQRRALQPSPHERAAPLLAHQQTFVHQHRQRLPQGAEGHAIGARQRGFGRQAVTRRPFALQDARAQRVRQPAVAAQAGHGGGWQRVGARRHLVGRSDCIGHL